mgnify:CR=1 FL=1
MTELPLLLEPEILEQHLGDNGLLVVDLGKPDTYRQLHVPGAVFLDYGRIVAMNKPVMGLLPDDATLQSVFSAAGISRDTHVVAYDDEGGGKAARLLWTLEIDEAERQRRERTPVMLQPFNEALEEADARKDAERCLDCECGLCVKDCNFLAKHCKSPKDIARRVKEDLESEDALETASWDMADSEEPVAVNP